MVLSQTSILTRLISMNAFTGAVVLKLTITHPRQHHARCAKNRLSLKPMAYWSHDHRSSLVKLNSFVACSLLICSFTVLWNKLRQLIVAPHATLANPFFKVASVVPTKLWRTSLTPNPFCCDQYTGVLYAQFCLTVNRHYLNFTNPNYYW